MNKWKVQFKEKSELAAYMGLIKDVFHYKKSINEQMEQRTQTWQNNLLHTRLKYLSYHSFNL